ncbi:MAG: glutamate--tRNA ligase [Candidatus Binatus sp.]|nr:glutamate--tRNA ligase [Candidatus Binatus sp.]MDO8434842.1 glutamate--tRNA ligase [Candidatus Binatus sp.]
MKVRTRFAPSPTGSLHIGNVRSGLFAWLFARHNGGAFILRIDDTDRERSSKESLEEQLGDLRWLGMDWDEGPPDPAYFQTNRVERHRTAALTLLLEQKAYPCYCSAEELDAKRKQAERERRRPVYDRKCRNLDFSPDLALPEKAAGRNYTIRFKAPLDGETVLDDLVKGRMVFQNADLDDWIIIRSDGSPIYNFASVLDDADLSITHIVRGDDHVPNTPRQIQMFEALGFAPPAFAHMPQVLGPDGSPLSKRHGATSVIAYREGGYFPEAMLNYLARLGWSHGDQEIFSKDELVQFFSFAECGKSAGIFNAEKLLWLNFHYLKQRPIPQLAREVKPFIEKRGWPIPGDDAWLEKMVSTLHERAKTLDELAEFAVFYLKDDIAIDAKAAAKFLKPEIAEPLRALASEIGSIDGEFTAPAVQQVFERVLAKYNLKLGQLAQPVRVAITGGTVSPGIYEVIEVLGKERTVKRLASAVERIKKGT